MLARVHDESIMERRPKWTIFQRGRKVTGEDERLLRLFHIDLARVSYAIIFYLIEPTAIASPPSLRVFSPIVREHRARPSCDPGIFFHVYRRCARGPRG